MQATGGIVTEVTIGGKLYRIHAFTSNGTFSVTESGNLDVLIVAGGGGGGGSPHGGGGGAGGLVFEAEKNTNNGSYNVIVGNGGAGYPGKNSSPWPSPGTNQGDNGFDSSVFSLTAIGGGGGGGYSGGGSNDTPGADGGSGGGGTDESAGGLALQPGSASGGFGNDGAQSLTNTFGGGGGGADTAALGSGLQDGGNGLDYSSFFTNNYGENGVFAGGGGGSGFGTSIRGIGGQGGGGDGGSQAGNPEDGLPNTGGGGGGQERYFDTIGGDGGSGIVLIRYQLPTTVEASANLDSSLSLFCQAADLDPNYIEPGYIEFDYFEGEQIGQVKEFSAQPNAVFAQITDTVVTRTTAADLAAEATQTTLETRIKQLDADFDALFSPSVTGSIRKNAFAILDSVTDIETAATFIADIDKTLESIVNLDLQAAKFAGIIETLPASTQLSADALRTRAATAQLNTESNLDIVFIVEYSATLEVESTAFARPTVFQEKDFSPRPLPWVTTRDQGFVFSTEFAAQGTQSLKVVDTLEVDPAFSSYLTVPPNTEFVYEWKMLFESGSKESAQSYITSSSNSFPNIVVDYDFNQIVDVKYVFGTQESFISVNIPTDTWHSYALYRNAAGELRIQSDTTDKLIITGINPLSYNLQALLFRETNQDSFNDWYLDSVSAKINTSERTVFNNDISTHATPAENQLMLQPFEGNFNEIFPTLFETSASLSAEANQATTANKTSAITENIESEFALSCDLSIQKQATAQTASAFNSVVTGTRLFALDSAQNAQFTFAADASITQDVSADLSANFAQTAEPLRIKQGDIVTDAVATALTAAGKVGDFLVTLEAFTTLDAVTIKRTGVVVEFNADFAQTTQESRFRGFSSTENSQFSLAASGDRIRFASEQLTSTVTLAVTELKILGLRAVLGSAAEFTGTINGLFKAEAELDSQATVSVSSTAFNEVPAQLNALASLDITSSVQFTLEQTELSSVFTQTTEAREFVFLDESVYEIRGEDRSYVIPRENREYTILEEDRIGRIL